MTTTKIIKRILVSPFTLCVFLLVYTFYAFERWVSFLRYGGEEITYSKNSNKMIQDVYELIATEIKKKNDESGTGENGG